MAIWTKLRLTALALWQALAGLLADLRDYYWSPYPFLLIVGAIARVRRRLKIVWLPRGRGRPPVPEDLVDLIVDMKRANRSWGALRISQELALLGLSVHKKTVQRILKENGMVPPKTRITPPTWSAFLKTYRHLWAIDFTSVFDSVGRQLFVLAIVDLATRQVASLNVTTRPTRAWIVQQLCNAEMNGFTLPEGLIADNDGIFGRWLEDDLHELFGIQVGRTARGMPWLNGICERFHLSLKREVLFCADASDLSTIRDLCSLYQRYFNTYRPHQGLNGAVPSGATENRQCPPLTKGPIKYRQVPEVGGLVTRFELAAA